MKIKSLSALLLSAALLFSMTGCGSDGASASEKEAAEEKTVLASESLYVEKIENLPENFILGMDASCVPALESSGVTYKNFDGDEQDVFQTLDQAGVNYIRVRVWNDPYDENGNGYGGGNCDIDNAVEIGIRATEYGMKLLVDFHYSDFWADPSKQMCPKAWEGMEIEEKTEAAYQYTKECLVKLKEAGVDVGMVQVGNETNGALAGEKIWFNIQYIMQAGARATREIYPEALVAVHFANPEKASAYADYAKKLAYYQVDYDVFGSSYYPYWHGTLENLSSVLGQIAETYGKKTMVMETSYAFTSEDTDFSANTVSEGGAIVKNYPFTVQGQANSLHDVAQTVAGTTGGIGVCYWEGTWITVGTESWEENSLLWERQGSGWASSYAAEYDPDDAGKYYGGCAVDNQAMFDASGMPLESLKTFGLLRTGNQPEILPDAIEDTQLTVDLNGEILLPETVNAVMTDNSLQPVPVTWNITDNDYADMYSGGPAKYDITGSAGGFTAHCYVSMVEYNFLTNDSFEAGDLTGWSLTDLKAADELYVEDKVTDSLTGNYHMHFWSAAQNSVEFTLEQTTENLPAGKYKFTLSIMGGDSGAADIYIYAKVNGETVATCPMTITSYNNWDTETVEGITCKEGDTVTVGICVKCEGTGSGAWGKIDDAMLNSMS